MEAYESVESLKKFLKKQNVIPNNPGASQNIFISKIKYLLSLCNGALHSAQITPPVPVRSTMRDMKYL